MSDSIKDLTIKISDHPTLTIEGKPVKRYLHHKRHPPIDASDDHKRDIGWIIYVRRHYIDVDGEEVLLSSLGNYPIYDQDDEIRLYVKGASEVGKQDGFPPIKVRSSDGAYVDPDTGEILPESERDMWQFDWLVQMLDNDQFGTTLLKNLALEMDAPGLKRFDNY